jgi:hypothetical protein
VATGKNRENEGSLISNRNKNREKKERKEREVAMAVDRLFFSVGVDDQYTNEGG